MKTKYFCLLLFFLLFLNIAQGFALKGTDVWKEESQITYDYNLSVNYNQYFHLLGFRDYNINNEEYYVAYIGMYEGNMFFKQDSASDTLISLLGLNQTKYGESLIDPETGFLVDTNVWSGNFYDTNGFEVGNQINDLKFKWEYSDYTDPYSPSTKSVNKYYHVADEEILTIKMDSTLNKEINVWRLSVDDFILEFQGALQSNVVPMSYNFKNIYYLISKSTGVLLGFSYDITLIGQQQQLYKAVSNFTAIETQNVKLDSSGSVGFPGVGIFLISLTTITLIMKFKRK